MRKFCFSTIAIVALMVAGSSTAFAANLNADGSTAIFTYWQADPGSSIYSFFAITNPSVTNNGTRDVTVTATQKDGTVQTGAGVVTSKTVRIGLGNTVTFFIAGTNHAQINPTGITDANFLTTTGSGVIQMVTTGTIAGAPGSATGAEYISAWGAIVIPGGTGFAMEAVGDLSDSLTGPRTGGL